MSALKRLKNGIFKLAEDLNNLPNSYQTIVNQEAKYKAIEQISASDLQSIMSYVQTKLAEGTWDDELNQKKGIRIPKGVRGRDPKRALSIITLPNGEYSIIVETKSKLHDNKKIRDVEPDYKKPHGAVKHGTPCMLLWPRKVNVPNKKWWSSVVDKEAAFEEVMVEAMVSMQNNPFIQNAIVGPMYHSAVHNDTRLPLYGEIAESGDFDQYLKSVQPSVKNMERILYSFLLGVEFLHQRNILHRDIKPVNILVAKDEQGKPYGKVMDFGESMKDRTRISGDPQFFSPQAAAVFFGKKPDRYGIVCNGAVCDYLYHQRITTEPVQPFVASEADDVWSIGAMMLSLYSDYGIIDKAAVKNMLTKMPSDEYNRLEVKIHEKKATEAERIQYIIVNCLQYDPNKRFNISMIIHNLPNNKLVQKFRAQIESYGVYASDIGKQSKPKEVSHSRPMKVMFSEASSSTKVPKEDDRRSNPDKEKAASIAAPLADSKLPKPH